MAGGTALALQLGHRKSIDLDFFSQDGFIAKELLIALKQLKLKIIQETEGTLDIIIDDVKVSFLNYPYKVVGDFAKYEETKLASLVDIACIKLTAISSRGSKKDFVDLYYILKQMSFNELWAQFEFKYSGIEYSKLHIMKSLVYFEDAQKDPDPDFIEEITWSEIQRSLEKVLKLEIH
jgi:hypothetical protein